MYISIELFIVELIVILVKMYPTHSNKTHQHRKDGAAHNNNNKSKKMFPTLSRRSSGIRWRIPSPSSPSKLFNIKQKSKKQNGKKKKNENHTQRSQLIRGGGGGGDRVDRFAFFFSPFFFFFTSYHCRNMSLVYPSFSNAGMMANLIMGGGPHRRICVSLPGGGMCFWIISALMKPVS